MGPDLNLKWISSHDLDNLAKELAIHLNRQPLKNPFEKEIILVQSQGMQRYVSFKLAEFLGVTFNAGFRFPKEFINSLFESVLPGGKKKKTPDKNEMAFAVMSILPELAGDKNNGCFAPVRNFLESGGKPDNLKLYQISSRIADLFDQYCTFRPEMILNWEQGLLSDKNDAEEKWQSLLWRELQAAKGDLFRNHFASLEMQLAEAIRNETILKEALPSRISVFGISYMPFEFFNILRGIAKYREVLIYQMNPCREYWGDITDFRKTITPGASVSLDELQYAENNRLLASLGKSARDWINYLIESDTDYKELNAEIKRDSLLHSIQSDILSLTQKGLDIINDNSVLIQNCHSPMRETEVLRDYIIEMLNSGSSGNSANIFSGLGARTLKPEDILVMVPDIQTYAPYIEAAFGTPVDSGGCGNNPAGNKPVYIPFNISDKSIRSDASAASLLMNILKLRNERFRAGAVLNIIESPALSKSIAFSEDEMELVRTWMEETGVRWGFDIAEKESMGLMPDGQNTWQASLDRLMMAYAMDDKDENFCFDILSYNGVETGNGITLGKLACALGKLNEITLSIKKNKTLKEWQNEIGEIVSSFIDDNHENSRQLTFISRTMNTLASVENEAIFTAPVSIDVIEEFLSASLESESSQYGFMKGGVTFCGMLPMRSIPFKVICMIGMNNDAFPRQQTHNGFDIMSKKFRPGDRSRRFDDRYLFLETLMSAREIFYISYTGRGIQDDKELPPSAVVSEFIDYIAENYSGGGVTSDGIGKELIIHHRLQPFSRDYYTAGHDRLFSYSLSGLEIARSFSYKKRDYQPLCSEPLKTEEVGKYFSCDENGIPVITLDELIRFFRNPSKFFLNRRLGIYLEALEEKPEETEIFSIGSLLNYMLQDSMLKNILKNNVPDYDRLLKIKKAEGNIPHGTYGDFCFGNTRDEADAFAHAVEPFTGSETGPLTFSLQFKTAQLKCTIDNIYNDKLLSFRPAAIKAKDRLDMWIRLTALKCTGKIAGGAPLPDADITSGLLLGKGIEKGTLILQSEEYSTLSGALPDANGKMEEMIAYYLAGITMPLPFFPETSYTYCDSLHKGSTQEAAAQRASDKWDNDFSERGDKANAEFNLCFGSSGPVTGQFGEIAKAIFMPFLSSKAEE